MSGPVLSGPVLSGPFLSGPVLSGEGLVAVRGARTVLAGVDVEVHAGERLALLGPSGSGKTTLLTLLGGLERPQAGVVRLGATDVATLDPPALRASVGLVLQGYGLVSLLTAQENVALPLMARRVPRSEVERRTDDALRAVGLGERGTHLVEELSGGEQQRVAVARALASEPAVLLADEPTAELDAASRGVVLDLLLGRARTGVAVVLATHDPVVARRCDRRLQVEDGVLTELDA